MLRIALVFALAVVAFGSSLFDPQYDELWRKFKSTHNKAYSPEEEGVRRLIWEKAVRKIVKHNLEADLGLHTYRLGINQFADMTNQEFRAQMNGYRNRTKKAGSMFLAPSHITVPDEVDWRKEGLVTPIKNQGQCGSCWAFSTTGSVEGQHKRKTGKLVSLSEQNLMDCSGDEGNEGCNGGLMDNAFEYIIKNHGIDTEASYPYEGEQGRCRFKKSTVGATITGYQDIREGDENALQQAVATVGPVSVAIDASSDAFQLYREGVYLDDQCTSTELDHGVLVVGYGTDDGQDYWIVKNSWGSSWGESGYIRMARNRRNMCGIATQASYPLV